MSAVPLLERSRAADPDAPTQRVIDATLRCVARWGLAKTTVDDVAREAGIARATLYRLFPGGRDALLEAVLAAEAGRLCARLDATFRAAGSLEDLLVGAVVDVATTLTGHPALRFLVAHEPEAVLPHLAFERMDAVLGSVAGFAGPYLVPWLPPGDDGSSPEEGGARAAEWVARVALSYLVAPSTGVDLCDPASARRLVRAFILPGLTPGAFLPDQPTDHSRGGTPTHA